MSYKIRTTLFITLSRASSLVMLIVQHLAGGKLLYFLIVKVYRFARPEAYQIVDTSEDARASRVGTNY